ncbi:DUF6671 family protein [Undibacterium squillarum]|uniref:DUF6671 domain-containing protein n=1 Tax=Undibacterium squillarum TaxID=1131567 RepID=A0ABQ2Y1U0_9BURK|nr:DUF6671 family protein [Undibacterium squillarum]GGX51183.1 hypothetical protein GCM10010946_32370 [Undibacterium squillarum]
METVYFLTQHEKAVIVTPVLASLGFDIKETRFLNTDSLGTFTGDVKRFDTQVNTAIEKARLAAQHHGARFGLGSEGSFGPDPYMGVSPWNTEVLALWDAEKNYAVHAAAQGPLTNYAQLEADASEQAWQFVQRAGFPEHGIIVGRAEEPWFDKEIRDPAILKATIDAIIAETGAVWLETDMRAHRNPSRHVMIRQAAEALAQRLASACPACQAAGFGAVALVPGALCEECGTATQAARARRMACPLCGHSEEQVIRSHVPASQCEDCNP